MDLSLSSWCSDNWSLLKTKKLSEVFFPGSHDSAAYTASFDKNTTFYNELNQYIKILKQNQHDYLTNLKNMDIFKDYEYFYNECI